MGFIDRFACRNFLLFAGAFWVSFSTYLLPLFRAVTGILCRFKRTDCSSINDSETTSDSERTVQRDSVSIQTVSPESEPEEDYSGFSGTDDNGFGEKEALFKFKFPTYEEFSKSIGKNTDSFSSTLTNKFEFISDKSFSRFLEELEAESFNSEELGIVDDGFLPDDGFKVVHGNNQTNSNDGFLSDEDFKVVHGDNQTNSNDGFLLDNDFSEEIDQEQEAVHEEQQEESPSSSMVNGDNQTNSNDGFLLDNDCYMEFDQEQEAVHEEQQEETPFSMEEEKGKQVDAETHSTFDSDSDSLSPNFLNSVMTRFVDSFSDGFLSDRDFEAESSEEMSDLEEGFLSPEDFREEQIEKPKNGDNDESRAIDSEESNKMETLWEHQELIEQLKMELKKVRATGLPTILEESESPKMMMMEDLKPWKIDEKFHHEDCIDELHRFYKSYKERMRKIDILNYQKMYTIGFLQLKEPFQSIPDQKSSSSSQIPSLLSPNFSIFKRKNHENDPTTKFVQELESDLEIVYVGQMCLSWEFLHWQYGKALDLWESDPRGSRRYNEVAGEFQQFQVVLQRFIEDEPFQGPRVQKYVKNRCLLRNLLQVPVIKEDNSKDKKKGRSREKGEFSITSDVLVEIIEESIRIFWRFVRADKDCTAVKGRPGTPKEFQNAADHELFLELRKNLFKKEKKLKETLRGGNCILRKFRACREENSDQVLYFFSQVDMKLVSRVLNMSKLTSDQLIWCRNKLAKIIFVNKRINVEPSFLLFPC